MRALATSMTRSLTSSVSSSRPSPQPGQQQHVADQPGHPVRLERDAGQRVRNGRRKRGQVARCRSGRRPPVSCRPRPSPRNATPSSPDRSAPVRRRPARPGSVIHPHAECAATARRWPDAVAENARIPRGPSYAHCAERVASCRHVHSVFSGMGPTGDNHDARHFSITLSAISELL